MSKRFPILLLCILFLIGCASTAVFPPKVKIHRFDTAERSPNEGSIDIFTSGVQPTQPFKKIAEIEIQDFRASWKQSMDEMQPALVAKAKELGGQGIVILSIDQRSRQRPTGMGGTVEQEYIVGKAAVLIYVQ